MDTQNPPWLLLVISLPTNSATGRMRIWRALKSMGCGALRDGAYLLPHSAIREQQLKDLSVETVREGGSAWLLSVHAHSIDDLDAYRALFDRSADHVDLRQTFTDAKKTLADLTAQEINRLLRKLRRDYEALKAIDYFPDATSRQTDSLWMDFVSSAELLVSPGEPKAIKASIPQLDRNAYQGRVWATRANLWVDRVASAWLIHRFIDKNARFLWLDAVKDCPPDALGFDFDGAAFTHIGDKVTFEVLLASFGLDDERSLQRLGKMVHALDVGGAFVPEASGFEAMMAGARQRAIGDDQLLSEIGTVLDSLNAHFSQPEMTT